MQKNLSFPPWYDFLFFFFVGQKYSLFFPLLVNIFNPNPLFRSAPFFTRFPQAAPPHRTHPFLMATPRVVTGQVCLFLLFAWKRKGLFFVFSPPFEVLDKSIFFPPLPCRYFVFSSLRNPPCSRLAHHRALPCAVIAPPFFPGLPPSSFSSTHNSLFLFVHKILRDLLFSWISTHTSVFVDLLERRYCLPLSGISS